MVSRRELLGVITTGATASLLTWMAVGENPPVSVDVDVDENATDVDLPAPNVSADADTDTDSDTTAGAWKPKEAAREMHSHVNEERDAAGRGELEWRADVASAARDYAAKLAAADTLTHTLDDSEPRDRYYADGISAYNGENINQTWWRESLSAPQELDYIDSPGDLGEYVATSWMNSPGHRDNMLTFTHSAEGIGIAKNDSGAVYSVQVFTR